MKCILNRYHNIRTITIELNTQNSNANYIAEPFHEIIPNFQVQNYDKIERVHFDFCFSSDTSAKCEIIIQILKRVPNLKSLSFKDMEKDVINMVFNRLQIEKLEFANLKKIDTNEYVGSIYLLFWFTQTFDIEELNIELFESFCSPNESFESLCSPNELLDNFSSEKLKKLIISSDATDNDVFLKKSFSNMKNLKELHLSCNPYLIKLFENNSTIEKVVFESILYYHRDSEMFFAILKTFESLKCIYMVFHKNSHCDTISAFKNHFQGREVELIFYSEDGYFQ